MKTVPSDGRDQERGHTHPRRQNRLGFYIDFGKSCMARRWETFFSRDTHRAGQQEEGSPKVALIIQIGERKKDNTCNGSGLSCGAMFYRNADKWI